MTLGGEGVFGFEFPEAVRASMSVAATKRFGIPDEREKQRQRQKSYWTPERRAAQSATIKLAHRANPSLGRTHAALMRILSSPALMAQKAAALWTNPDARARFLESTRTYWADSTNRAKRGNEIRRRYAERPDYAKNVSEGKKRHYREHPETGLRHGEFMRLRALEPGVREAMSTTMLRAYKRDPTLITRQAASRKRFYEKHPDARQRAADSSRMKAADRKSTRERLLALASEYKKATGVTFTIPSRSDGGWKMETMLRLIQRIEAELVRLRSRRPR